MKEKTAHTTHNKHKNPENFPSASSARPRPRLPGSDGAGPGAGEGTGGTGEMESGGGAPGPGEQGEEGDFRKEKRKKSERGCGAPAAPGAARRAPGKSFGAEGKGKKDGAGPAPGWGRAPGVERWGGGHRDARTQPEPGEGQLCCTYHSRRAESRIHLNNQLS